MLTFKVALWFAVAVNIFATCYQLYWARRYMRKYDECEETMHELQNVHALLTEHLPVER